MKRTFLLLSLFFFSLCSHAQLSNISSKGVGGGGALFFPKINPANDDEFYIACDMSEMFHSINFGQTYQQLDFQKLPVGNTSTYEFTVDPGIAYSIFNDGNDGYPVKSTDGGLNWNPMPGYNGTAGPVYRLIANYDEPTQIIINHYGDIVISNDGGNSFQLVKNAANNGVGIILSGAFFDGNDIWLATNEGLFHSVDNGVSFNPFSTSGIPASQVIWNFSSAKSSGHVRFICITADATDVYNGLMPWDYYNLPKGVYTMDDLSGTWVSRSAGINFSNDFVMYSGMASNDINTIYLAGSDNSLNAPLVMKSTDGGLIWDKVFRTNNNQNIATGWSGYLGDKNWSWGETCFGIGVARFNPDKILFGDFGFVHTSSDGGQNWKQAYVNSSDQHPAGSATPKQQSYHSIGLENTTCWQVHFHSDSVLLAAFSDIGLIRSTDGGETWGFTGNGLSVNSVYRITSGPAGNIFAATSGIHDMYQSTRLSDAQLDANDVNGKIFTSSDAGANWSVLHSFNHPVFWFDIDPANPNRMYCSVIHHGSGVSQGGIWKTDDLNNLSSSTWTQLPAPPRTEGHPACVKVLNDGKVLCTYSGRRNSSGAFTASSGVFLYDPVLNSWSDLSDPGMLYWTKDVVPDPSDPTQNTWYVCVFSGWGGAPNGKGGLYRTTDRGQSWIKLTASLFDRVTSITFHPLNPDEAFLTTETQGLWHSSDLSASIPQWTLVNEYNFRQPERVYFNPAVTGEIWISSFGNGMKKGNTIINSVRPVERGNTCFQTSLNPGEDFLSIEFNPVISSVHQIKLYDIQGRKIMDELFNSSSVHLNIGSLPGGLYILESNECFQKIFIQ